ncbi:Eco57I restriction-modification methylase domain-containing protein [Dictyobacter aurantiacus]|nr:DNA methyltransferase [Dictyobacter aurantiacus]
MAVCVEDQFGKQADAWCEQVRVAVEILLDAMDAAPLADKHQWFEMIGREVDGTSLSLRDTLDALYQSGSAIIMRLIVLLYMRARHLQPLRGMTDQPYGDLNILDQLLCCPASSGRYDAWKHLKLLFLLCDQYLNPGSGDFAPHYVRLFLPGDRHSIRALRRALAVLESWDMLFSDSCVKQLLTILQTTCSSVPPAPGDFKDFPVEAIGLAHQYLLDWQLCWDGQDLYLQQGVGARKASGTFYTPPTLARSLTECALEPLVYRRDQQGMLVPRTPEEIVSVKVCDPACGPGFFLLAALRYMTDALCKAYQLYCCPPVAAPEQQRARAAMLVAQQCLYGVDLNLFTVELARVSLWLEVGDDCIPLNFIDHQIKPGNALVGTWSHLYQKYPVMAWLREAGDENHTTGVHYRARQWGADLLKVRREVVKPEFQQMLLHDQEKIAGAACPEDDTLEEGQMRLYDRWCALWFWPPEHLDIAPTPATFARSSAAVDRIVATVAEKIGFFHWELEFPAVFQSGGFSAILSNPPWETLKPCSREFFQCYDPHYLSYNKQEALLVQRQLFARDEKIEQDWLAYQAYFKYMANWVRHVASPSGDSSIAGGSASFKLASGPLNERMHAPFRYQGNADLNSYKLFLELAHYLLRPEGQLGMLVPAAIYTDQGTAALRQLFLERCQWRLLFGFVNRRRIFAIHSSFKFAAIVLTKGGHTTQVALTFNQEEAQALADLREPRLLSMSRQQILSLSPSSQTILEIRDRRDLEILEKIYPHSVLLGAQHEQSWRLRYAREFDMTNDSHLFAPVAHWQSRGYAPDVSGCWIDREGKVALPLYEGRMIGAFDPALKGWVRGRGRSARWQDLPLTHKRLQPQFLMAAEIYRDSSTAVRGNKLAFMDVCSPSNARSMYASIVNGLPCGNVTPVLQPANSSIISVAALAANLNSFVYDYLLRCRLGGVHLNYFIIAETPLLSPERLCATCCPLMAARLNLILPGCASQWLELRSLLPELGQQHWRQLWAVTAHERLRLRCMLDAIVADLYGLDYADLCWILSSDPRHIKGFWRIDKEKPEPLRQTTLTLQAFEHLIRVGRETFEMEGWQLPADVAHYLGPRFTSWQCEGSIAESWRECEALADLTCNLEGKRCQQVGC